MDDQAAIEHVLARCGGYADRRTLLRTIGRRALDRAVADGFLERRAQGIYASAATAPSDARLAAEAGGVLIGASAARHWGWELLRVPGTVTVAVRHHRRTSTPRRVRIVLRPLPEEEIAEGIVTTRLRTVLDCSVLLPFEEALAVADSALRSGSLDHDDLIAGARRSRGPGRRAKLRVATLADGNAANPFESALRVRCLDAGLGVDCQVPIRVGRHRFRVDLADSTRRIVVEGDSFAHHASPEAFARDCIRYTELTVAGWTVLRMPYRAVVDDPDWCRAMLQAAVDRADRGETGHRAGL